jgi:hypothetical protein
MRTSGPRTLAVLALSSFVAHCGLVFDLDALGPGAVLAEAGDAGPVGDGAPEVDVLDGGGDGRGPTGLDDRVALPELDATPCRVSIGGVDFVNCKGSEECRMATADSGRCEDCLGRCTLHQGDSCTQSWQCDSLFECFRGRCTNRCTRGEHECGKIESCLDVGFLGGFGLCDPSAR